MTGHLPPEPPPWSESDIAARLEREPVRKTRPIASPLRPPSAVTPAAATNAPAPVAPARAPVMLPVPPPYCGPRPDPIPVVDCEPLPDGELLPLTKPPRPDRPAWRHCEPAYITAARNAPSMDLSRLKHRLGDSKRATKRTRWW